MNTINAGAVQLMQDMQKLSRAAQSTDAVQASEVGGMSNHLGAWSSANTVSSETPNFATLLKASLDQVNEAQSSADTLQKQYETGTSNVDLSDVMISMQKASLSLQMIQNLRGRLVNAYQDLINTPL